MPALEAQPGYSDLPAVLADRVCLVNGSDYFSRPGPRLVDRLEMPALMIHLEPFGELTVPRDAAEKHHAA